MGDETPRSARKSLTKAQLENPDAIELLELLQGMCADGCLLDEEIAALHNWLAAQQESELPALEYLRATVEVVLEDGVVSPEERAFLQKAVETVLPKEHRDVAVLRRREAKAGERQAIAEEKARQVELAAKSKPVARFDFMVAGVLYEGRDEIVKDCVGTGDPVFLVREPGNAHSPNAILVRLGDGQDIGYVPEVDAKGLARLLDDGALQAASIKKVLSGRSAPFPVVWGELYPADSSVEHAVSQAQLPAAASGGCLLGVLTLCFVAFGAVFSIL